LFPAFLEAQRTLMAPGVLYRVIYGSANPEPWQKALTTVRPALLQSYRRHHVKYADYPAILPHEGSSVRGSLVTGLTDGDIYRLDIFEGDQYVRKQVKVQVLKDVGLDEAAKEGETEVVDEVWAESYVWQEGAETLEPQEWDFEEFKRDKMQAWMGEALESSDDSSNVQVDEGFADVDRVVAEQERQQEGKQHDPTGGRGANGKITKQLEEAAV